jgi:fido (protein-threonine AMPylation protein)
MATAWNEDPPGSESQILANATALLGEIAADTDARRSPSVTMAQDWHRRLYVGAALPVAYYAGEPRDSDPNFPELVGYEVAVGPSPGMPSARVPAGLADFEARAQLAVSRLDKAIPVGAKPKDGGELAAALTLCAVLHGEWVRIHPFANGNGPTARLWANWAALRYHLPPFVTIKPRPGQPYGVAAMASISGDHTVTVTVFDQMFREYLSR